MLLQAPQNKENIHLASRLKSFIENCQGKAEDVLRQPLFIIFAKLY